MLTSEERRELLVLLAHAVRPQEALNLDQLEGYLFGVVITPDVVQPGEWFADIFGESFASFADSDQANARFSSLEQAYNRLNALWLQGDLLFPFDLTGADPALLGRVGDWTAGLERALNLRAWLWMPEEVPGQPERDEADASILTCLMIVAGIAHLEKIPEIFEGVGEEGEDLRQAWTSLLGELPAAVELLQARAAKLRAERLETTAGGGDDHACSGGSDKANRKYRLLN